MKFSQLNLNNEKAKLALGFRGKIAGNSEIFLKVKKMIDCGLDSFATKTGNKILSDKNAIKYVKEGADGFIEILPQTFMQKISESLKDIGRIPIMLTNSISENLHKKFPDTDIFQNLYNSTILKKFRDHTTLQTRISALEGMYENGAKFINESMKNGEKLSDIPFKECNETCEQVCSQVKDKFAKTLNKSMGEDAPTISTKHEKFINRLVSGLTGATFLYTDYLNKGELKKKQNEKMGKQSVAPEKYAKQKRKQEVISNVGEAIMQFIVLGVCAKAANKKIWFAPVVITAIGFSLNIVSRLITGQPLIKIKKPDELKASGITMNENSAKLLTHPDIELSKNNAIVQHILKQENTSKEVKKEKPLLSLKNLGIACGAIIATGFTLRFAKSKFNKTDLGKALTRGILDIKKWYRSKTVEKVYINKIEVEKLKNTLSNIGEYNLRKNISNKTRDRIAKLKEGEKLLIGRKLKTTKIFGKIEIPTKKLYEVAFAPLKFVHKVISWPYQTTKDILQAMKIIKPSNLGKVIDEAGEKIDPDDIYNFKNIFLKYKEFEAKYPIQNEFTEKFDKYVEKMQLISNSTKSSKFDNSASGIMAQTLGALSGIGFNVADEYNTSRGLGKTDNEAEKDARLRGINKFLRMTTQGIIAHQLLNQTFKKQYNGSLYSVALITFAATILTDMVSRVLSGMPFKRMSAEEQEAYKKRQSEGPMKGYFKLINKLAG